MKIAPKLALAFAVMAIIPLALSSVVFMASTNFVATNISDRAQDTFSTRLTDSLSRATRLSATAFDGMRDRVLTDLETSSAEIARSLNADAPATTSTSDEIIIQATQGNSDGQIDLRAASVRIENGAIRDAVAGTLSKLQGLQDVGRVTFLRNQDILSGMSLILEDGLTIWFPKGSEIEATDLRESDWYLSSLEVVKSGWHGLDGTTADWMAVTPVEKPDGTLLGVFRFVVSLSKLLEITIPAAVLPAGASAHLIVIPEDHPNLFPHRVAQRDSAEGAWQLLAKPEPLSATGDDNWLKILSDMRSGVGGLITAESDGSQDVWSFQPLGAIAQGSVYLAITLPQSALDSARAAAEKTVSGIFRTQLRDALMFAMAAGFAALGLGFIMARTLTTPLQNLHTAATKLGQGDFDVRVTPKGSDEIAELAQGFNEMVPALADQVRIARDLKIAQEIQQQLIPAETPRLPGFDISGRANYCDETGGDYLDFVPNEDKTRIVCAIGDVTGHGVGAALMMASARAALRAHARQKMAATDLIGALNLDVVDDSSGGRFMTLFYAEISVPSHRVAWISCGHDPSLVFDASNDSFQLLDGDDIPLGVDGSWRFEAKELELDGQKTIVGYTDGIREAKNGSGEMYGLDRLRAVIIATKQRGADGVADAILDDVAKFRGDAVQSDDETILVIKAL